MVRNCLIPPLSPRRRQRRNSFDQPLRHHHYSGPGTLEGEISSCDIDARPRRSRTPIRRAFRSLRCAVPKCASDTPNRSDMEQEEQHMLPRHSTTDSTFHGQSDDHTSFAPSARQVKLDHSIQASLEKFVALETETTVTSPSTSTMIPSYEDEIAVLANSFSGDQGHHNDNNDSNDHDIQTPHSLGNSDIIHQESTHNDPPSPRPVTPSPNQLDKVISPQNDHPSPSSALPDPKQLDIILQGLKVMSHGSVQQHSEAQRSIDDVISHQQASQLQQQPSTVSQQSSSDLLTMQSSHESNQSNALLKLISELNVMANHSKDSLADVLRTEEPHNDEQEVQQQQHEEQLWAERPAQAQNRVISDLKMNQNDNVVSFQAKEFDQAKTVTHKRFAQEKHSDGEQETTFRDPAITGLIRPLSPSSIGRQTWVQRVNGRADQERSSDSAWNPTVTTCSQPASPVKVDASTLTASASEKDSSITTFGPGQFAPMTGVSPKRSTSPKTSDRKSLDSSSLSDSASSFHVQETEPRSKPYLDRHLVNSFATTTSAQSRGFFWRSHPKVTHKAYYSTPRLVIQAADSRSGNTATATTNNNNRSRSIISSGPHRKSPASLSAVSSKSHHDFQVDFPSVSKIVQSVEERGLQSAFNDGESFGVVDHL